MIRKIRVSYQAANDMRIEGKLKTIRSVERNWKICNFGATEIVRVYGYDGHYFGYAVHITPDDYIRDTEFY